MTITQLGFHKYAKDSSYLRDFLSGAEPTGKFTFENAAKNKENHTKHRLMGDLGGVIGGAAMGIGTGIVGSYGVGKALKLIKPSSKTGQSLIDAAKYQFQALNIPDSARTLKRYQEAGGLAHSMSDNLDSANRLIKQTMAPKISLKNIKNMNIADIKEHLSTSLTGAKDVVKKTVKDAIDINSYEKLHGESPQHTIVKGYGIMGAGIAGAMGAATNVLSADVQYRSGQNQGKKMQELSKRNKK